MSTPQPPQIVPMKPANAERPWGQWAWIVMILVLVGKSLIETDQHTTYPGFVKGTGYYLADKDPYISSFWEYRYSPTFATVFSVFTKVPLQVGGAAWILLTVGVLFWGIRQLLEHALPQNWNHRQRETFFALSLLVCIRGLWASQSTPLVIGLVCATAAAIVQKRWWQAALFLALPAYIKVWPIAIGLLLVSCHPRKLATRYLLFMAGLALLPLLIKPPAMVWQQYQNWHQALFGPMQVRHIYRDMWALWESIAPPVPQKLYMALQLTTALVALGLCLWQRYRAPSAKHFCTFVIAIWMGWQLSFGPGVERNTFCLGAPLLAWGLISSRESGRGHAVMFTSFALTVLFSFGVCERELVNYIPAVLGALPFGAVLFAGWMIWFARKWPATSTVPAIQESISEMLTRSAA